VKWKTFPRNEHNLYLTRVLRAKEDITEKSYSLYIEGNFSSDPQGYG
jgi:hypothetical protein